MTFPVSPRQPLNGNDSQSAIKRGPLRRAVFLDRDGTINVEANYLIHKEDFAFIPGVPQAIKSLKQAGYLVIVVTNQSGVARGYFSEAQVHELHLYIQQQLATIGTAIDGFYICPHHPTSGTGEYTGECECRKGKPGMLLQAAADFGIDLKASYMIGDKAADLEAGIAAGCRSLLVLTGYGRESLCSPAVKAWTSSGSINVCDDLSTAAELIIKS